MPENPDKAQGAVGRLWYSGALSLLETGSLTFSFSFHQPLMDNLESQTYEVFEKDPIKYSQYQQV